MYKVTNLSTALPDGSRIVCRIPNICKLLVYELATASLAGRISEVCVGIAFVIG